MDTYLTDHWEFILSMLPDDLDKSAFAYGAILRKRDIKCASDLIRLIFAYAWGGISLRQTAAWAEQADIASVSDVALLNRFRNSPAWIGYLLTWFLTNRTKLNLTSNGLKVRIVDATSVTRPGSIGADWRVHLGFNLQHMRCDHIELTDCTEGESLSRITAKPKEVIIGDRVYGRRSDVYSIASQGADVIVRLSVNNLPLLHTDGEPFRILKEIENLKHGEVLDVCVATAPDSKNDIPSVPGRFIAKRKDPKDADKSKYKLIKERKKKGKQPTSGSLAACEYIFVFTTLGQNIPASDILELYRFRWQIEMAFKRMKSLLHLDEMTAKDDQLCKTFILAKLLAVLLIEDIINQPGAFPPCVKKEEKQFLVMASL